MIDEQTAFFRAFSDPTRLRLVNLLRSQRSPNALCVNALAALLGVTQSAISQHIRLLKSLGLVKGERKGNYVHYSIAPEALERCRKTILATFDVEESPLEQCDIPCRGRSKTSRPRS